MNDICPVSDLDREACKHCNKSVTPKYAAAPTDPGMYDGVPEDVYHGDKTSLSSTGARKLLRAPALFKHELDHGGEHRPEYDFGSAAHKYVLGEGSEIVIVDADDWRTAAAKKARKDACAAGKVPILPKDDLEARRMAERVRDHALAAELLRSGLPEQSIYWTDPLTWVRLRARPDWITEYQGRVTLVDYKTSRDAEPRGFAKSAAEYRYHQQAAWYLAGARDQEIAYDPRFVFLAQEKTPPYLVSVHEYTAEDLRIGEEWNRRAIDIYAECKAADIWPAYGDHIHTMRLPNWARTYTEETSWASS